VNRIALIDPVGKKAGMDHYDLLLLEGIAKNGFTVRLYSNFEDKHAPIAVFQTFYNHNTSKLQSVAGTITGFIRSLLSCRKEKMDWLIVHVFRAGLFDLFTFSLAKLLGFKICAIVHDIESLDTITLPFVRKMVIDNLPDIRVVHNHFSLQQLAKSIRPTSTTNTVVIPHVNFIHLFKPFHEDKAQFSVLKNNWNLADAIDKKLKEYLNQKVKILLFFGQIKNAKGLDLLLKAIAKTEGNYKLIIAGRVREGSWANYEKTIDDLKIRDKIIPVIRFITDEERNFLFSISNAVILPYTRIYQSGVLLMAMSFPKVVIASNLSPNTDIVTSMHNGIIFNAGDAQDLSEKILLLLSHPELEEQLSVQALEHVKSFYNPEKIGGQFSAIFQ
jgi:D-inositol-3-phosphate glycosyltransferase